MNESSGQPTEQGLYPSSNAAMMTKEEKIVYWGMVVLAAMMTVFFAGLTLFASFVFHKVIRSENVHSIHQYLIFLVVVFAAFLCLLIYVCFIIIRRRMKTGSYLPTGEKLVKWRARQSKPEPLWKRITLAAIYVIFAFDLTFSYLTNGLHSGFLKSATIFFWYIVLFILWVAAVLFIIQIFAPMVRKKAPSDVTEAPQSTPESESHSV
jgi:MFS family permease